MSPEDIAEFKKIAAEAVGDRAQDRLVFYNIGRRDAIAEALMMVRAMGRDSALEELSKQLLSIDPEHPNPHAAWFLEQQAAARGKK